MSQYIRYSGIGGGGSGSGLTAYPTAADLPATALDGTAAVTLDTDTIWVFNLATISWKAVANPATFLLAHPALTLGTGANGLSLATNQVLSLGIATASLPGALSAADWTTFNGKQNTLTLGTLSTATTGVTVGAGTGAVVGTGTTINIQTASAAQPGLLAAADFTTFAAKQTALTPGTISTTTTGLTIGGGTSSTVGPSVTVDVQTASAARPGLLSAADFTTFAAKQPALGFTPENILNKGAISGYCPLDASQKVPVANLPSVVMEYQGAWNPTTNTPALSDATGANGNVYYVSALQLAAVSGLTDPSMVNFQLGDLVVYSASAVKWQLVTPAAGVSSVNGSQGAVSLQLASSSFANQGTSTTVLHGNASGATTWSAVVETDITLAANTTNNVTTVKHGFTPQLSGNALQFLNGLGNYAIPVSGVANSYTAVAFTGQTSVNVVHNFGAYPIVQVIDSTGAALVPLSIVNNTINDFTVTMVSATTGNIIASVGSPQPANITTTAISYAIAYGNNIVAASAGGITITLPTAVGHSGAEFTIDNASPSEITVNTTSSQLIQGQLTQTLPSNSAMTVYSNNAGWRII